MDPNDEQENEQNQAAYREMKGAIDQKFPKDWFVAIHEGRIVADAAGFEEIDNKLTAMGIEQPHGMVVQAGVSWPEKVMIFCQTTSVMFSSAKAATRSMAV